jgi:hypothetical protein
VWVFAPAWSSPTTTTLEGGDGDPAIFMTDLLGSEPQQVEGVYLWRDPVVQLTDPGSAPRT